MGNQIVGMVERKNEDRKYLEILRNFGIHTKLMLTVIVVNAQTRQRTLEWHYGNQSDRY